MSKGDGTFFVPTAPSPQLVNGAIISQNLTNMVKDYLDDPNVTARKNPGISSDNKPDQIHLGILLP